MSSSIDQLAAAASNLALAPNHRDLIEPKPSTESSTQSASHTPSSPLGGWGTPAKETSLVPWGTGRAPTYKAKVCRTPWTLIAILRETFKTLPEVFKYLILGFLLDAGELVDNNWNHELLPEKSTWVMPIELWGDVAIPRLINLLLIDECVFWWGIIKFSATLTGWELAVKSFIHSYGREDDSVALKDVAEKCRNGDKIAINTILGKAEREFVKFMKGVDAIVEDLHLVSQYIIVGQRWWRPAAGLYL